jgi:hypothetical protein
MLKQKKPLQFLALAFGLFIIISCSSDDNVGETTKSTAIYSLQIIDSLQIEYLGQIQLIDRNERGQFLLQDTQRKAYLVANEKGEIIHQFIITADNKNFPGAIFESPAFYQNDLIIFYASKGLYFFDFEGNFQFKTSEPLESNVYTTRMGTKAIFEASIEGEEYLLVNRMGFLNGDANTQEYYDSFQAINLFNPSTQQTKGLVGLENESTYRDGKYHDPYRMQNRFDIEGNQLAIVYKYDPYVYHYTLTKDSALLNQSLSLKDEILYIDGQKDKGEPNKPGAPPPPSNIFTLKLGESEVGNVALLKENLIMVQYNPGLPEEKRELPKVVDGANGNRIEYPDNIPRDHYQVFKDGEKAGGGELPTQLQNFIFEQDGFLWFSSVPNQKMEEDVVTWYKVKLLPE